MVFFGRGSKLPRFTFFAASALVNGLKSTGFSFAAALAPAGAARAATTKAATIHLPRLSIEPAYPSARPAAPL